ncbi:MAG: hypothetical protein IPF93_14705 [Saprospiraceae bacterium]|nr:hypothetical protein [Saprospiraceae bacterium]
MKILYQFYSYYIIHMTACSPTKGRYKSPSDWLHSIPDIFMALSAKINVLHWTVQVYIYSEGGPDLDLCI